MSFFETYGDRLMTAIQVHLFYVLISVAIGFVVALILGILLSRIPRYAKIIMPILSIFQTIPGIVFIGILFLYLGMIPATVITALAVYSIFPVLKNTYTGLLDVKPEYIEAAKGCGMSPLQTLFEVELPLASPSIITGLRMSTIYTVSWAVLAAMIGLGGLGEFIYIGIASNNDQLILAGAIPSAIMAIILSLLIDVIRRVVVPKGLRSVK
ncbi:ABC transporter permease [Acetobacterium woodii]|uniref:Glycine betaine/carnitine/choline ABC transport system permease protein OpuCB2 n=1 Tax=Acetobacterium woodii (strain ATCC 29683 / DSM 1030 / JCM 2381 / KCTC 1655 / WB1) TaxID=931626 RepID=H6LBF9_ACEWD|nr:ABC transporter permease [Acetobacterium woodii]AFA48914.1 glycine betaine/carnitine/choline ABC transport system permease protein OpuCB2 [Acetobacterium woodii DSM 1030]